MPLNLHQSLATAAPSFTGTKLYSHLWRLYFSSSSSVSLSALRPQQMMNDLASKHLHHPFVLPKSPHLWPGSVSTPVSLSPPICPLSRSQSNLGKMYYLIGQNKIDPVSSLYAGFPSHLESKSTVLPDWQLPPGSSPALRPRRALWPSLLTLQHASCHYDPYSCCSLHREGSHRWSPGSLLTACKSLFKWHLIRMPPIWNSTSLAPAFLFLPPILSEAQFICWSLSPPTRAQAPWGQGLCCFVHNITFLADKAEPGTYIPGPQQHLLNQWSGLTFDIFPQTNSGQSIAIITPILQMRKLRLRMGGT